MRVDKEGSGSSGDTFAAGDQCTSSNYTEEYLLSKPYESRESQKIPASEVCEALSTPLRFLAVLLGRHPGFAKILKVPSPPSAALSIGDILPDDLVAQLDLK
jgi:hypothetical protein